MKTARKLLKSRARNTFSRTKYLVTLCTLLGLTFMGHTTYALDEPVISDFNGELEPEMLDGSGDTYGIMAGGMILGQLLDVEVAGTITAAPTGSAISFDGSGDSASTIVLTWDGEDEDPALTPDGLGSQNLTIEEIGFTSQDALKLSFVSVVSAGTVFIEVFTEDGEASSYSGSLTTGASSLLIPYAAFAISQGGGALFNQVGAIQITFSGGAAAEFGQLETTSALGGITKVDTLLVDGGSNGLVDPGDTLRYTITIPAASSADGVILTDNLDTNTTLVVGSVSSTSGSITSGNTGGDSNVVVDLGTLPAADVVVTFDALVNDPYSGPATICNQASVAATGLPPVLSDDPDDGTGNDDPTCTTVELDTTPPVLDIPADTTVDRGTDTSPTSTGQATATDDNTANPNVTFVDAETPGPVPFQSVIARTWTATDDSGNTSQDQQLITLADVEVRSLVVSQPTYGLFSPLSDSGKRQLGTIDTDGNVTLLGTDTSLSSANIATSAGFTTYDRASKTVYALGKTASDNVSRVFSIDVTDGSSTNAPLSFGTISSVVGIWWDEVNTTLYGVFQVGAGLADRQLGSIDPTTGSVLLIGSPETTILSSIGGVLTGSRTEGEVYFLGSEGGLPGAIYSVDLSTGVMSNVPLSGANYNAIAGMNFNQAEGKIYALMFQGAERRLAEMDPDTGGVTPLGTSTIAGGGVPIATYTGVNTLDEDSGTFLFVGRYNNGTNNVWAIFGVDIANGDTTFSEIDNSTLTANGYYGLDYAEVKELNIINWGFAGSDFYLDVPQGTDHLKVTSTENLVSQSFANVPGATEINDGGGQPNRFLIPSAALSSSNEFFRVETE